MAELASLVQRLEVAVSRLESMSGPGGSAGDSAGGAVAAYVEAFDEILKDPMAQYLSLSQQIGGEVQKHGDMMKKVFEGHRQLLVMASTCQKPCNAAFLELLKPLSKLIAEVQAFREKNRNSALFNHLSAVSEGVPAFGWFVMEPKPGPYVKDMQDAAMFYTNRVVKEHKGTNKTHVEWVKAYVSIFTELQCYIKQHHTTGLTWNKSGPIPSASAVPPSAPSGGCPPPPPPGPPPPPMDLSGSSCDSAADERNALFASINKGGAITKGLKHVSDDEKTHKNPNLRSQVAPMRSGPKPFSSAPRPAAPAAASACKAEPVLMFDGKKWKVENQDGAQELVIGDTELRQVVYVFKCTNSMLRVKGKINSIILDNCKKMGLVFDDVVGIVEVINCKGAKVQVLGKMPTISINKTDGCQIYLSKDSMNCEIISAKSSEMNILVPTDDGEYKEHPVPEQFKTSWDGSKLVTTAAEITG